MTLHVLANPSQQVVLALSIDGLRDRQGGELRRQNLRGRGGAGRGGRVRRRGGRGGKQSGGGGFLNPPPFPRPAFLPPQGRGAGVVSRVPPPDHSGAAG